MFGDTQVFSKKDRIYSFWVNRISATLVHIVPCRFFEPCTIAMVCNYILEFFFVILVHIALCHSFGRCTIAVILWLCFSTLKLSVIYAVFRPNVSLVKHQVTFFEHDHPEFWTYNRTLFILALRDISGVQGGSVYGQPA